MKVTFIGGGSYRTLPIVRSALGTSSVLQGGEICLFDLHEARAEAMGRMIMRAPEFAGSGCTVTWGQPIEASLDGADLVKIGFPVGNPVTNAYSDYFSRRLGFMSSDQLSVTGAFLALQGGPIILNYARMMERYCPQAWFTIFANPVAVYSGMVNNHTSIRTLGVCGGYTNHMWDLSRMLGREVLDPGFDVEVAGVNHISFIVRGAYQGRDLFTVLREHLAAHGLRLPRLNRSARWLKHHIAYALKREAELLERFDTLIFSTEGDGMAHLFYEDMYTSRHETNIPKPSKADINRGIAQARKRREAADARFRALLDEEPTARFWANQAQKDATFSRHDEDIVVRIIRALGGDGPQQIAASFPNHGAVAGFTDRTVLEYSQTLDQQGIRPYGKLFVPPAFHGLIAALAAHQTLLGDAIATEDPAVLYQALFSYPVKFNTAESRQLFCELLDLHRDVIPPAFRETRKMFTRR